MNRLYRLLSLRQGEENKNKVKETVIKNISFRGANLWILASAIFIASIGLNVNSAPVIIGAMLISPLMGPIVGAGFALATYDFSLLKRCGKNLLIATFVGLVVSSIYFYISPFKEAQSELLSRTSPTIYDVLIAFLGGIVGAISITRVEKGNSIPGVAIATALMPPLCTAGFGLTTLNFKFILGALYLYSINCFFIGVSTFLIIKYLKYKPIETQNPSFDKKVRIIISVIMILLILPSFYLANDLLEKRKYSQNVDEFIYKEFIDKGYTIIYKKIDENSNPRKIDLAFLSHEFDSIEIKELKNKLQAYNLLNTEIDIKQNSEVLNKELLAEINVDTYNISEKDLLITNLSNQIKDYQLGDYKLNREIKVIFPQIDELIFSVANSYLSKDEIEKIKIVAYRSSEEVDENKLTEWLKLNDDQLKVIKINSYKLFSEIDSIQ